MTYILGHGPTAEFRLGILNELTTDHFISALQLVPKLHVRILVLGCGSGHLEEKLSSIFQDSHFVGIDLSEDRIQEAEERTRKLTTSNRFTYLKADLTSHPFEKTFDVLISRYVLSHLPKAITHFDGLMPFVKPGGFVCIEESAAQDFQGKSIPKNQGYSNFLRMVEWQIASQKCSFDVGSSLHEKLVLDPSFNVLRSYRIQPVLTDSQKSILRLGVEEAKQKILHSFSEAEFDQTIASLKELEENSNSVAYYLNYAVVVAQKIN